MGGILLRYNNGTWEEIESGMDSRLYCIRVLPGGRAFAAGPGGMLYRIDPAE